MYLDEYKRWLAADLEDADLKPELSRIEGNDEEIKDRFAVALKFGTAGLRGVLGAGTNRMNIYVVRQATQGLANWVKTQGGSQTVAISYDSRLKSDVFAKTAAGVLAANGIKVRIYDALMPVPALSFATRYYECNAGIMVTASHNPAKYNGYKAYGPDGCQMTDEAADNVNDQIQKPENLTGAKLHIQHISTAHGLEIVRAGKAAGVQVTCEATPHHMFLTENALDETYNTSLKVNPPLRTEEDAEAIRQGVIDGTVDAIVTDHAPHTPWEKAREFELAPFGMIGLETSLSLVLTELVNTGKMSVGRMVELMAIKPREILGLDQVQVKAGSVADLTVFDPSATWTGGEDGYESRAENSGFAGRTLTGRATDVFVGGKQTLADGCIC